MFRLFLGTRRVALVWLDIVLLIGGSWLQLITIQEKMEKWKPCLVSLTFQEHTLPPRERLVKILFKHFSIIFPRPLFRNQFYPRFFALTASFVPHVVYYIESALVVENHHGNDLNLIWNHILVSFFVFKEPRSIALKQMYRCTQDWVW